MARQAAALWVALGLLACAAKPVQPPSSKSLFESAVDDTVSGLGTRPRGDGGKSLREVFIKTGGGRGDAFLDTYLQQVVDGTQDLVSKLPLQSVVSGRITGEGIGGRGGGPVGPYGYDWYNPGQSPDPNQVKGGQSDQCTSLEEAWLRLCSAPPPSFLQTEQVVLGPKAPMRGTESSGSDSSISEGRVMQIPSEGDAILPPSSASPPSSPSSPSSASSLMRAAAAAAMQGADAHLRQRVLGPPPSRPAQPASRPFFSFGDLFPFAPSNVIEKTFHALREHGTRKLVEQANSVQDDTAVALTNAAGMKGGLMGMMSPAMGLNYPVTMGPLTRGPEYYDSNSMLGPDLPTTASKEERCTTMMNTWLYKCNLIPF